MTFDKQVEEAKKRKLESRIIRDMTFIILGIIFLALSFLAAYKDKNNNKTEKKEVSINEKNSFIIGCI